ncbi:MAG: DUF3047 domain-containing protein [Pseudomonadota bacterium]
MSAPAPSITYVQTNSRSAVVGSMLLPIAHMIAIESGSDRIGQWISERRDIRTNYRRAFGEEPGRIDFIFEHDIHCWYLRNDGIETGIGNQLVDCP